MRVIGAMRVVTNLEEARIKEAFLDNVSPTDLAAELGLSRRTIYKRYRKLHGRPMHSRPASFYKRLALKPDKPGVKKQPFNPARFYHSDFEPA